MWRKNRHTVGTCTGVDLNRNFDQRWKYKTKYHISAKIIVLLGFGRYHTFTVYPHLASGVAKTTKVKSIHISCSILLSFFLNITERILCDDTYPGTEALSEPETSGVNDFLLPQKDDLVLFIDFHAYGQLWLHPWGHTGSVIWNPDRTEQVHYRRKK